MVFAIYMEPLDTGQDPEKKFSELFVPIGLAVTALYIVFVVGWLSCALIPAGPRRGGDPRNACINNLRQIDGAKQQWALETHAPSNAVPTWNNIQPYLGRGTLPVCPAGGSYTIGPLTNASTCTIKGHVLD